MEYTEERLVKWLGEIEGPDESAMEKARERQAQLAKPPGSLGTLEDISIQLAGVTGQVKNEIKPTRICVLAADNGVAAEGVSSAPQSVTLAQSINLTRGLTGASSLAKYFGDGLVVVDMGIAADYRCPAIIRHSLGKGTKNLYREPAMTRAQAVEGILTGMELAAQAKQDGIRALGVGEMGIGNTTTSSAILACLLHRPVGDVTGRGGGVTDASFAKKKLVIETALRLHRPDPGDPVDVLSKVGGFDLCAMTGVFLGAARERIPAAVDGLISITAALCAARLNKYARAYMFPSHASFELGYKLAADELGLKPWLQLGMRLGEGSGCPIAFRVMEAACAVMNGMATFPEAAINDDYLAEIRAKDSFTV
jgi:nicotinate-nucleotide--dimethylbenzimidazole phosphoribosyltransferase